MLKYEGIEVGTQIRAYDFEVFGDRKPCFIEGKILNADTVQGVKVYTVQTTRDVFQGEDTERRVGSLIYVPMETMFDWKGRVEVLN